MAKSNIPIIDMQDFPAQSGKLMEACRDWGCFRNINHGISPALMGEMKVVTRSLLDLPVEIKLRNSHPVEGKGTAVRAVRTTGTKISFDDLVAMMKSEDIQLSKETSDIEGSSTVLIASHNNPQKNSNMGPIMPSMVNQGVQSGGYGSVHQGVSHQQVGSQQPNGPGHQWSGFSNTPQVFSPMFGSQGMSGMPIVQPMTPQFGAPQGPTGGFKTNGGSTVPMVHSYIPSAPCVMPQSSPTPTAFAGFTGQCTMPNMPYSVPHFFSSGGDMIPATAYQMPPNASPEVSSTANAYQMSTNTGSGPQTCVPLTSFGDIEVTIPFTPYVCSSSDCVPSVSTSFQPSSDPLAVTVPAYHSSSYMNSSIPISVPIDTSVSDMEQRKTMEREAQSAVLPRIDTSVNCFVRVGTKGWGSRTTGGAGGLKAPSFVRLYKFRRLSDAPYQHQIPYWCY
ncbi:hypothetical protein Vadar_025520 [Vaccinium darrowii]|uniref:Uncharacterized protein n=1 Tax=Vaccinium darrowii TaxID=229202 RepID=A0ACB7Z742_9ERIC|nr:hypothetical protein Vadar_025520 [Vaccinium darrowii]